jgi:anaerobic ribonucleoside-triphosphate reductase activating protein
VFGQGCPHRCPGCHNPGALDFEGGVVATAEEILAQLDKNPLLAGITLTGGEPVSQAEGFLPLARAVRGRGKDIVLFSGYTFEELIDISAADIAVDELLSLSRLLIDGRFLLSQRDVTLRFRGSRNQRVLDLQKSLQEGRPVWAEGYQAE